MAGPPPRPPPGLAPLLLLLLLPESAGAGARPAPQDPPELLTPLEPRVPRERPRGDRPAAHVVASPWPSPHAPLLWHSSVAPALIQNGVRLRRNRLVIPRDGLYFVYAAAAFRGRGCSSPGGSSGGSRGSPLLLLAVWRRSREYPRAVPLLRAARSACRAAPRRAWADSLYQGAVFRLRRGDRLAATASGGLLDRHGPGLAYFGVLGVD